MSPFSAPDAQSVCYQTQKFSLCIQFIPILIICITACIKMIITEACLVRFTHSHTDLAWIAFQINENMLSANIYLHQDQSYADLEMWLHYIVVLLH